MASDTATTLVQVPLPPLEGARATFRVLHDGRRGSVDSAPQPIGSKPTWIGRASAPGCFHLEDPRVSRQHLRLWSRSEGTEVLFEDASTNGTFVNGQRTRKGPLEDGDVLRVGDSFILIRFIPDTVEDADSVTSIVGTAPVIRKLRSDVDRVGPTDATVLVIGESGTGKELVANELHSLSRRRGPFIAVNCSAIPATLAESQLFGHVAGSFTGATEQKGFFRAAHQGTLFLDEVGELPIDVQPKLLRVLEDHKVTPMGGTSATPVDVRIVVATNRELEDALDEGRFRGDLYARLAEITVRTPPLRERQEDILPLFALGFDDEHPVMAPDLIEALLLHPWPFNVRELFKVAKELQIKGAGSEVLDLSLVQHRFKGSSRERDAVDEDSDAKQPPNDDPRVITKKYDVEDARKLLPSREQLEELLAETKGNISEIARRLSRSRRQIHRYLKMYSIDISKFR